MDLSEQQQAAVTHSGCPALVIAGAGSGKTRTLTAKIAHLIEQGMDPERILAITFTNKAADEMKNRLMEVTGLPPERFPWVRTYHSACFRIFKQHCDRLGYRQPLQIYAGYQQQKTLKEVLLYLNVDKKFLGPVQSAISHAKNSGDPKRYIADRPPHHGYRLAAAYERYNSVLKERNALDFDDILLLTRDVLRDFPEVRERWRKRFLYLLVDEYQDTNNLQEELTRLLMSDGNLFCVGDDWQAIYSFRGSNVDHFLTFEDNYPGARKFRLEQNFRSADEIVQVANHLILNNDHRMDKHCFSDKSGGSVEVLGFDSDREEALWVAGKIGVLARKGVPLDQMVVLYRTRFCSLAFEQAFRIAGVPYRMMGGKGFFDRKEILDIIFYLTAAVFPRDDVAFERIINIPKRGIGPGTIKKISALRTEEMSLQEGAEKALRDKVLTPKLYTAISDLMSLLEDLRTLPPSLAIQEILDRTGYLDYLKGYVKGSEAEFTDRKENIEQLAYAALGKGTIDEYLEEASLVREDKGEDGEAQHRAVYLSTIHAAKGLEFSAVFVVGCEETLFPHWRSMESARELEEERRLMYVSVTRSERFLYLSYADWRKGQYNMRSRFIDEIEEQI